MLSAKFLTSYFLVVTPFNLLTVDVLDWEGNGLKVMIAQLEEW